MRHVYLVEAGDVHPLVFGTRERARRHVEAIGEYQLRPETAGKRVEFWEIPDDLDALVTIYRVPVG